MRHHSKLHISGREFTKKLRFNNNDYILTSVFDGGEDFDFDKEWELEQRKKIRRRLLRPHADFGYPMFESLFDTLDDEIFNDEVVDDDSDFETVYFEMKVAGTGRMKEVHYSSKSRFVNWSFECLSSMFAIDPADENKISSIDDFVQKSGKFGNQNEYKIKLKNVNFDYATGEIEFVVDHIEAKQTNGEMLFKMYVDNENKDFEYSLYWEGHTISFTELKNLTYISKNLMYMFLNTNGPDNNDLESYRNMFAMLMKRFYAHRINCTVCKRKMKFTKDIENINSISLSIVPKLFSIIGKYGRDMTGSMGDIDKIMNWELDNGNLSKWDTTNDGYYVIISGDNNDRFVRMLQSSMYFIAKNEFMYGSYEKKSDEKLYAKEKLYCIIMPFSKFMNALTRLSLFTTKGEK